LLVARSGLAPPIDTAPSCCRCRSEDAGLLVAGNAINDLDMLNLAAGKRILVGEGLLSDLVFARLVNSTEAIRVASPEKLGEWLANVS
jgi:hypothetical protein